MRCATFSLIAASAAWAAIGQGASAQSLPPRSVVGQYLEVRPQPPAADVRNGPAGEHALLAWKVREGTFNGVRLDGLAVVAAVFAEQPLQDHATTDPRAVFIVDADATEPQQAALLAMARKAAGENIRDVVAVKQQKIDLKIWLGCGSGYASLKTDTITVRTRRLEDRDRSAHEIPQPSPLAEAACCEQAFTLQYTYSGSGVNGEPARMAHSDRPTTTLGAFLVRWSAGDREAVISTGGPAIARRDFAR